MNPNMYKGFEILCDVSRLEEGYGGFSEEVVTPVYLDHQGVKDWIDNWVSKRVVIFDSVEATYKQLGQMLEASGPVYVNI